MVWFSIKILQVHFGNSVRDNSSWDKISHSLAKKKSIFETECNSLWDKRIVNQILLSNFWHTGQIYTLLKFIKKEIGKIIAQLSIWKCELLILDMGTQLNSLELKWI